MSGAQKSQEIPVMLVCENNVFIAVPQSLLIKESAVFKAKFNTNWQGGESGNVEEKTNVVNTADQQKGVFVFGKDRDDIQPKVIKIKEYKAEAVKLVIEWIKGYEILLSTCKDFTILAEMLILADFYDIPRPVKAIESQIDALNIDKDNLIEAMAAVGSLEKLKMSQDMATNLESRCVKFASENFSLGATLGYFVTDNCDNIDLVIRLINKSKDILSDSVPSLATSINCKDHVYSCRWCATGRKGCLKCNNDAIVCSNCKRNYGIYD